jgi:hypothetical protein
MGGWEEEGGVYIRIETLWVSSKKKGSEVVVDTPVSGNLSSKVSKERNREKTPFD